MEKPTEAKAHMVGTTLGFVVTQSALLALYDLNGFQYHDNWLQNLLVAASLGGQRASA